MSKSTVLKNWMFIDWSETYIFGKKNPHTAYCLIIIATMLSAIMKRFLVQGSQDR